MSPLYEAVAIGGSAGAMTAIGKLLPFFAAAYPLPIIIALHLHPWQDRYFLTHFGEHCALKVKEADEKEAIQAGTIYFAPPNYHLLIEHDRTFSLSIDPRVNYSRPSIDITFESAADTYTNRLVGVILTGANNDGAQGLHYIQQKGGLVVVQDPLTAESSYMPKAAMQMTNPDHILSIPEIGELLTRFGED